MSYSVVALQTIQSDVGEKAVSLLLTPPAAAFLNVAMGLSLTASVFINDDASPRAGSTTAPAKLASGKPLSWTKGQAADAHLKRHGPQRAAVVAVTNGRPDLGTWERIFSGQAEWLARES